MIQNTQNPVPDKNLCADIEGACLLLSYAAQCGLELKAETAKTITRTKELLTAGKLTGDDEALFYLAYQELAKLASPVTVAGLRAATEVSCQTWCREKLHLKPAFVSDAKRAVSWYWRGSITCLVILLLLQIYWVIGSTAVTAIKEASEAEAKVALEIEALKNKTPGEAEPAGKAALDAMAAAKLEVDKTNLRNRIATYHAILRAWNYIWQGKWGCVSEIVAYRDPQTLACQESESGTEATQPLASFVLIALQGYVLPLLYGLLGACTYVLRMLSDEIRNLTYTLKSHIRYKVRLVLGTLSGLAITWFFQPSAEVFKSLSPLAIAFLAGYSVEILFAAMDRFVGAFSTKSPSQGKTNPGQG